MNKRYLPLVIIVIISFTFCFGRNKPEHQINNSSDTNFKGEPTRGILHNSQWLNWIYWDGESNINPTGQSGGLYLNQRIGTIFQDGFVWGGIVRSETEQRMRVGGQTYFIGTVPGRIISPGEGDNPDADHVRLYKVHRNHETLTENYLREEAALVNMIAQENVTSQQIEDLRMQYQTDWEEWPFEFGAPFTDADENGIYDPAIDIPGIENADITIWFVINDLDESVCQSMYGSLPMGIEAQITLWGYDKGGALGNMLFKRCRFINKSNHHLDSMFISMWSDPDIGDSGNDFVGCDIEKSLGFGYNGEDTDEDFDEHNLAPAAVGYDFLQGPIVYTGNYSDTAIYNFQKINGYINLPMTSFSYFASGSIYPDPRQGDYEQGTLSWYNLLNGRTPVADTIDAEPYYVGSGPNLGEPTSYCLSGNPVADPNGLEGDIDGQGDNLNHGDRRIVMSTGPFHMAPHDEQELVVGIVGGIGNTRYESISNMKENDVIVQRMYNSLFNYQPVNLNLDIEFLSESIVKLHFITEEINAEAINVKLNDYNHNEIYTINLFDDGVNDDGIADNGIWGNVFVIPRVGFGMYTNADVEYEDGTTLIWEILNENITTGGKLNVSDFIVISDNINHDGVLNPSENIQYGLQISNHSYFNQNDISIIPKQSLSQGIVITPTNNFMDILNLSIGDSSQIIQPYYSLVLSETISGNILHDIEFKIYDTKGNVWYDTVSLSVGPPVEYIHQEYYLTKLAGDYLLKDALYCQVIYPDQLLDHNYKMTFQGPIDSITYNLFDETAGVYKLVNIPFPDKWGNNSIIVDGFQIIQNDAVYSIDTAGWEWQSDGERWLEGAGVYGYKYFMGGIEFGQNFFTGSTIENIHVPSIKIVFNNALTSDCAVYRRDLDYQYAGTGAFPGAVYDIYDIENPRRLNVTFVEDYNYQDADFIWNPTEDYRGNYEYFLIMNSDYNGGTNYDENNSAMEADVLYGAITKLAEGHSLLESDAEFYLYHYLIDSDEIYAFNPVNLMSVDEEGNHPRGFSLKQNYPNPFNPTTNIEFLLPFAETVELEVFNMLGQKVKTLVNCKMIPGRHIVNWDGKNNNDQMVSSGIYIYHIKAGKFNQSRKMLFLK